MGGPFSLRCLSPLCSPAVGVRQTQMAILGMLCCGWGGFAAQENKLDFFQCDWRWADSTSAAWNASMYLGYFCNTKCQRGFKSTLAFVASRRTCRSTAVFIIQATWSYTKPASREACRRAAVTPQPSCFPSSSPAPKGRGVGCRALALLLAEDPFALEVVAEEEEKKIDGDLGDVVAPTQPEVHGAGQTGGEQHVENEDAQVAQEAAAA